MKVHFLFLTVFLIMPISAYSADQDIFGAGLSRDTVVHLDLNTFWLDDSKQPDEYLTSEDGKRVWRQFDSAVLSYLKSRFATMAEFDSCSPECEFTMVYHPDIGAQDHKYGQHKSEGFNSELRIYGFGHDIYATAYAALGAFTEPDVLIKPAKWYAPGGVVHGVSSGQPEVLVIASPEYSYLELESTQDLINELQKRRVKLLLIMGGWGTNGKLIHDSIPPPALIEYARKSGGGYAQLVFDGEDDAIGRIKLDPQGLP